MTLTSLAEDLLDAYAFIEVEHDIPISEVRSHVGTVRYPQSHPSHLDHGHSGSAHEDPPTDHSIAAQGEEQRTDPSISAGHQFSDVGLDDVEFSMTTIGYLDLLTCDDTTSMPSHLVSPLHSSLERCVQSTHVADADLSLDQAQKNLDTLVDRIEANESDYYQFSPPTQV